MKKTSPNLSYDADADVLSLAGSVKGIIDHAAELGNFVVHFTKDNRPVLVEILEASKIFGASPKPIRKMATPVFA